MSFWPKPQFGLDDWSLDASSRLATGFFQLDQLTLRHRGYKIESLGPMQRELILRDPAMVVILVDPIIQAVVLVEQFRVGAAMSQLKKSPWMLEWVAGICDEGENPAETCRREVFEETGLVLTEKPTLLYTYCPSPGGSNELIYLFVATCDSSRAASFRGQTGEFEDLKVHVIPISDALDALVTGQVNNAATIIGLQWLCANRSRFEEGG